MVVLIPDMKKFDQVREIKESFHEEEFLRKDLKDIYALFVRREREEYYKQKEHLLSFRLFSFIYLTFYLCLSFSHISTQT